MNRDAEYFADVISGAWRSSVTERDWFQMRGWCHGAALMTDEVCDKQDLWLLTDIATNHEFDARACK